MTLKKLNNCESVPHTWNSGGLQNNKLANIIVGNYFSWWDILAYTLGIATVLIIALLRKKVFINEYEKHLRYEEMPHCFI